MSTALMIIGGFFGLLAGLISILILARKYGWKLESEKYRPLIFLAAICGTGAGVCLVSVFSDCCVFVQLITTLAIAPSLVGLSVCILRVAPILRNRISRLIDRLVSFTENKSREEDVLQQRIAELEKLVREIRNEPGLQSSDAPKQ